MDDNRMHAVVVANNGVGSGSTIKCVGDMSVQEEHYFALVFARNLTHILLHNVPGQRAVVRARRWKQDRQDERVAEWT